MRRERLLSENDARQILKIGQHGVLSAITQDGIPYGIPLNYYYDDEQNAVFFHCALEGKKLDCIAAHSRVAFTVVTHAEIDAPRLTTLYESAIVTGVASLVTDFDEKKRALVGLCRVLTPSVSADSCKSVSRTAIVRISIETVTGKRNAPPTA
jgi:nitroimidazol reductase NimA-like FMN-containing flavoprotein (pyridoxamine 5'-phosphate oxidase superfamily)